jgi:hypothetical protein
VALNARPSCGGLKDQPDVRRSGKQTNCGPRFAADAPTHRLALSRTLTLTKKGVTAGKRFSPGLEIPQLTNSHHDGRDFFGAQAQKLLGWYGGVGFKEQASDVIESGRICRCGHT